MKKNKKDLKKHGIISVVQSPNEENIKFEKQHKTDKQDKPVEEDEHGIISVVQSPDEETNKQQ
jgi:hypothetical protein